MRPAWMESLILALAMAAALPAQTAATTTVFVPMSTLGHSGLTMASAQHRLDGWLGGSAVAPRMTTASHVLSGGLAATLDAPTTGRPWLCAVTPASVESRSGARLVLHGTELDLAGGVTVRIDQRAATVGSVARHAVTVDLPLASPPGPLRVELQNGAGSSLLDRGVCALPLFATRAGPPRDAAFELIYRGRPGDLVVPFAALGLSGSQIPLPGYHHGFVLDVLGLITLPPIVVVDPGGSATLPVFLPAGPAVWLQGLALASGGAYLPGSFTNALRL